MTNQEAFTKMATHLLKQNTRSENSASCLYRGPGGTMCAVGCLIPDDQYKEEFEKRTVTDIALAGLPCLEGLNLRMLKSVQNIHDHVNISDWRAELIKTAEYYNLEFPVELTAEFTHDNQTA